MKKSIVFTLSFVLLFSATIFAQSKKPTKIETKAFINKTNVVLLETGIKVKKNEVYTGCLHKANTIQKEARFHYRKGETRRAVNKSYLARKYSFIAYNANSKKKVPDAWRITKKEKTMITKFPTNEELKKNVSKNDKKADKESQTVETLDVN